LYTKAVAEFSGLSWVELRHHLFETLGLESLSSGRFLFRGQSSADWGLVASFDRLTYSLAAKNKKERYGEYISELREAIETHNYVELANYLRFATVDGSLVAEMIAQHHGAPTRILDWSLSPYVAAFFAVVKYTNDEEHSEVAIWALDTRRLIDSIGTDSFDIISWLPSGNERAIIQQSRFTRNKSIYNDLVDLVSAAEKEGHLSGDNPILYKFRMPINYVKEAGMDLALMGINRVRMFPGLESLCHAHGEKLITSLSI
jgi:hypothetical protein